MAPPPGVRPKGSPPATKTVKDRMAPFFSEPGKEREAQEQAPTAAQRQVEQSRQRPPVERQPAKAAAPAAKAAEAAAAKQSGELERVAAEKTAEQEAAAKTGEQAQAKADEFPDPEATRNMKSGELGRHYKKLKVALDTARAENKRMAEAKANDPAQAELQKTLEERTKRLELVESELRYSNYEADPDYQETYWKPYEAAFNSGRALMQELRVREVKDEVSGEVSQPKRSATADDFDRLVMIDNTGDAAELAEQMFGPTQAAEVMRERRKVRELNAAKEQAKDKFKKEGGEIFKQRQDQLRKTQEVTIKAFEAAKKAGFTKYPEVFGEVEGDEAGNTALAKHMALADACFTGKIKQADGSERQLTQVELAEYQGIMRNKAGAFGKLVHQKAQLEAKIKELETKLKEFEDSEPGPGEGAAGGDREAAEAERGPKNSTRAITNRMGRFVT